MKLILYKYLTWESAEKSLSSWSLKATLPHHTNDPFEFMPSEKSRFLPQESKERMNDICFLCFSSLLTSAALWGHYGESHKGVCLEFEFPIREFDFPIKKRSIFSIDDPSWHDVLVKVFYSSKRFSSSREQIKAQSASLENITYDVIKRDIGNYYSLLSIKDVSWKFESEYRIISTFRRASHFENGMVFLNLPMKFLTGIYLGARAPHNVYYMASFFKECLNKIPSYEIKALYSSKVDIVPMTYHQERFEIVPNKNANLMSINLNEYKIPLSLE